VLRKWAKATLLGIFRLRSRTVATFGRRLVVFAPHQDDETLCCGGAIAAATRAGSTVHVVYLTDGGKADDAQSAAQIADVRRGEAGSACAILGVPRDHVLFLGFPDGSLTAHQASALEAVEKTLEQCEPDEIYIPARFDEHPDHQETNRLVRTAARQRAGSAMIHECPVWALNNWPIGTG
jgi:N-acetylglucosamine malate deacetylase 1